MSNLREAAETALEVLEGIHYGNMTPMAEESWNKAAEALREALAEQPAQQQEPDYWLGYGLQAYTEMPFEDATPLWISPPPQRTWVGLSKEQMFELFEKYDGRPFSLMLAVHDKLKEKNG